MNLRLFALLLFFAVFVALSPRRTLAETSVGVSIGDWVTYEVGFSTNGTVVDPSGIPTNMSFQVLAVAATNITLYVSFDYADGSSQLSTFTIDVGTARVYNASGDLDTGWSWVIPANLQTNDFVNLVFNSRDEPSFAARINETVYRQYLGVNVQVNHLNLTTHAGSDLYSYDCYYAKDTGMLFEMSSYYYTHEGNATRADKLEFTLSGASVIPEFTIPSMVQLLAVISLATAILYKRKRQR